jgi:hypothetical protein
VGPRSSATRFGRPDDYDQDVPSEQAGQASPIKAAAALREILRLVEAGQLSATPGLQRLIQGAAIGLDEDARSRRESSDGPEPNG